MVQSVTHTHLGYPVTVEKIAEKKREKRKKKLEKLTMFPQLNVFGNCLELFLATFQQSIEKF